MVTVFPKQRTDFNSNPPRSALSRSAIQFDRSTERKFSSSGERRMRAARGRNSHAVTLSWSEPAVEESPAAGVRRMRTSPGFFMRKH